MEREVSLPHSPVPILKQTNAHTFYFLKIHLTTIFPSTPGSPKWSLSLRFPHQNPVKVSPLPHTRYMPRPTHFSWFYHLNNIGWAVQINKWIDIKRIQNNIKCIRECTVSQRHSSNSCGLCASGKEMSVSWNAGNLDFTTWGNISFLGTTVLLVGS